MKQETYRSSTLGNIPLSFTGRRLLANLRDEVAGMAERIKTGQNIDAKNWEGVSLARGRIAEYMSKLEQRTERPRAYEERNEAIDESRMTPDPNCDCVFCTMRKSMQNQQNYGGWPFGTPTRNPFRAYDELKRGLAEEFGAKNVPAPDDGPKVRVHHVNSIDEAVKIMAEYEAGRMPPETPLETSESEAQPAKKSQVHSVSGGSTFVLPDIPEGYVLHKVGELLEIVPMTAKEWNEIAGGDAEQPGKPEPHEVYEERNARMSQFIALLDGYRRSIEESSYCIPPKGQERIDKARMAVINAYEAVAK